MEINEEKRAKFMEFAGKRVNNVLHDIQILEPMARSSAYDFTKEDVNQMFTAMQETLEAVKEEYYKKFEEKAKVANRKVFSFGAVSTPSVVATETVVEPVTVEPAVEEVLEAASEVVATEEF